MYLLGIGIELTRRLIIKKWIILALSNPIFTGRWEKCSSGFYFLTLINANLMPDYIDYNYKKLINKTIKVGYFIDNRPLDQIESEGVRCHHGLICRSPFDQIICDLSPFKRNTVFCSASFFGALSLCKMLEPRWRYVPVYLYEISLTNLEVIAVGDLFRGHNFLTYEFLRFLRPSQITSQNSYDRYINGAYSDNFLEDANKNLDQLQSSQILMVKASSNDLVQIKKWTGPFLPQMAPLLFTASDAG